VGESLVALDQDELRRRLRDLPTVRSFRIDRAFPHTLRIVVAAEQPLAVVRRGSDAWLVSERGRVIREIERGRLVRGARVWTGADTEVTVGEMIGDAKVRAALDALRRVPKGFPVRIEAARVRDEEVTFVLAGSAELRLGGRTALRLKLAVAARVLGTLTAAERGELEYLDVTVPALPVGADKSQLSS
jgi:cell division septal protein FtsQ